ncbi:uncharacterized protein LOC126843336 [Adelges cooleyi]|uniref:uncharacterized protein LOC126843336 n=1 Tax=Adelges cooleyi TaxID=133065 RepID=UPI00217FD49E|nr:uncharacterized protein LOC126843336 [Adelges cooleyi]
MSWKIIILLASLNVLVTSLPNDPIQDQGDKLYDGKFVSLLNSMKTLDEKKFDFNKIDVQQLSEECGADENCLGSKKASLEQYHQKMQGIQCVNGLIVMEIWEKMDKDISNFVEKKPFAFVGTTAKDKLQKKAKQYIPFMRNMLSVLQTAEVAPCSWQIEMFTFLAGLDFSDLDFDKYVNNFPSVLLGMNIKKYIDQCTLRNYLKENPDKKNDYISRYVNDINAYTKHLYENPSFDYAYRSSENYTIRNLMLVHFYDRHAFIYDWSTLAIKPNMRVVETRVNKLIDKYNPMFSNRLWATEPIYSNKFHSLIVNCIHLRLLYHVYVHIHIYHTIQSQLLLNIDISQNIKKGQLLKSWSFLVGPLKKALRELMIEDNMYWSLVRFMMDSTNSMIINKLTIWEHIMRKQFSIRLEEITFVRKAEADGVLTKLTVSEDCDKNLDTIKANAVMLDEYTNQIIEVSKPVDGVFVQLLVLAEKNPFHSR